MIRFKYAVILLALLTSCTVASDESIKPEEDSSGFVLLSEAIPDAILEIRYHSTYNFIGDPIPGYEEPIAIITKTAADANGGISL